MHFFHIFAKQISNERRISFQIPLYRFSKGEFGLKRKCVVVVNPHCFSYNSCIYSHSGLLLHNVCQGKLLARSLLKYVFYSILSIASSHYVPRVNTPHHDSLSPFPAHLTLFSLTMNIIILFYRSALFVPRPFMLSKLRYVI